MLPDYYDVISRIEEKPSWYTVEGYPRYGEFTPGECNIYSHYSALFQIACQDCGKRFNIGVDVDDDYLLQFKVDMTQLANEKHLVGIFHDEVWLPITGNSFVPHALDENGDAIYRTLTIDEYVKNWGFGDPPRHGCVGDTMRSMNIQILEAWDRHFGQKTEKDKHGLNRVVDQGELSHLPELEGYQFPRYEWYRFYDKED